MRLRILIAGIIYYVFLYLLFWFDLKKLKRYFREKEVAIFTQALIYAAIILAPLLLIQGFFLWASMDSTDMSDAILTIPTEEQRLWAPSDAEGSNIIFTTAQGDSIIYYKGQILTPSPYKHLPNKNEYFEWMGTRFSIKTFEPDTLIEGYYGLYYVNSIFSDSCAVSLTPFWFEGRRTGKEIPYRPVTFVANDTFENCIVSTMHGSPDAPIDTFVISRDHGPVYISFKNGKKFTRPDLDRRQ